MDNYSVYFLGSELWNIPLSPRKYWKIWFKHSIAKNDIMKFISVHITSKELYILTEIYVHKAYNCPLKSKSWKMFVECCSWKGSWQYLSGDAN